MMTVKRYPIDIEGESALIGTAGELVAALDVLQGNHDRAVLEQLHSHLADVLGGPRGLYATLRVLTAEDQLYLVESLGPQLVDVVQTASALRDILATLAESGVEEKLVEVLGGDGLRALVGSAEELAGVLEWVYGASDWLVLELMGEPFLRRLLQNGHEFSVVLRSLDPARQQQLIEWLGWEDVVSLVHDRRDLAHLLRALPAELSNRLLNHFTQDQLWDIVRDKRGFQYLYSYLEAEEAAYLGELLEVGNA
jgi:hypothetical protein